MNQLNCCLLNRGREQEASERVTHSACGAAVVAFIFRRVVVLLVASLLAVSEDVIKDLIASASLFHFSSFFFALSSTSALCEECLLQIQCHIFCLDNWSEKAIRRKTTGTGEAFALRCCPLQVQLQTR